MHICVCAYIYIDIYTYIHNFLLFQSSLILKNKKEKDQAYKN